VRGIGTAARAYFGKEVHQLSLAEAATLAGMTRAPNLYSPATNPARARERRNVVLARMRELGMLADADAQAAQAQPLAVKPGPGQFAGYYTDYLRRELEDLGMDELTETSNARVHTTLDGNLQRFAEAAVVRGLDRLESRLPRLRRAGGERLQAVLIAMDPRTGQVRALVGGRDYQESQFNRAVFARRQPGSAFKPFVYLAALEAGHVPTEVLDDSPVRYVSAGKVWAPEN
jgi:penicillin-binding protein 1B